MLSDTHPDAEEVQFALIRQMSVGEPRKGRPARRSNLLGRDTP
jgi:hypothetical protein